MEEWLRDNPSAVAFSSRSMQGPISNEGALVVILMQFRDPLGLFVRPLTWESFGYRFSKYKGNYSGRFAIPVRQKRNEFYLFRVADHSKRFCFNLGARAVPACQEASSTMT